MSKLTKADLKFLQDVADGLVKRTRGYSRRRGGYENFHGGETRARKLAAAGLLVFPGTPDLGRPTYATLTEVGVAALQQEQQP